MAARTAGSQITEGTTAARRRRNWSAPRCRRVGGRGARSEQHPRARRNRSSAVPASGQADERVPTATCSPVMIRSRSTTPTRNPTRSKSSSGITPGCSAISPPIRAQPAWRQPSARPPAPPCARARASPPRCSRGRRAARRPGTQVVDAHRHQVDADRVEATGGPGDLGLGADAVGGRHQHRLRGGRSAGRTGRRTPDVAGGPRGAVGRAHRRLDARSTASSPAAIIDA